MVFLPHYGPGVQSNSNRNEKQEYFLASKEAGAWGWQTYHPHVLIVLKSGNLTLLEISGPVQVFKRIALTFSFVIILNTTRKRNLAWPRCKWRVNSREQRYEELQIALSSAQKTKYSFFVQLISVTWQWEMSKCLCYLIVCDTGLITVTSVRSCRMIYAFRPPFAYSCLAGPLIAIFLNMNSTR